MRKNINLFIWFGGFFLVILILTLAFVLNPQADFAGADDKSLEAIQSIDKNFSRWFSPIWEPPAETESALFALQAAIGGLIIGYFLGYLKYKK